MLTVGGFNASVETTLTRMGVNLAKDGFLSQVLMGFTRQGKMIPLVAGPEDEKPTTEFGPKGEPVYVVPGRFTENTQQVEQIFARHEFIAAITVGELWALTGAAASRVRASGGRVADDPDRVEMAALFAYAPSLKYFRSVTIPMVRGSVAAGSTFIKSSPTFIGTAQDSEGDPDRTGSVTLNWAASTDTRVDLTNLANTDRVDRWLFSVLH